jgi:hypothetical protein
MRTNQSGFQSRTGGCQYPVLRSLISLDSSLVRSSRCRFSPFYHHHIYTSGIMIIAIRDKSSRHFLLPQAVSASPTTRTTTTAIEGSLLLPALIRKCTRIFWKICLSEVGGSFSIVGRLACSRRVELESSLSKKLAITAFQPLKEH